MTTTVVKTIGTGGDYSTLQAWEDAAPANLVSADQVWEGRVLNNLSSGSTLLTVSGSTSDATRFKHLTAAPGVSFRDHANKLTNPLRADNTKGVEIRCTANWSPGFQFSEPYCKVSNLLVTGTGSTLAVLNAQGIFDSCIFESTTTVPMCTIGGTVINSLFVVRRSGSAGAINGETTTNLLNCTVVCPSDFATKPALAIKATYGHGLFKNLAVFGCTSICDGSGTNTTCYTDIASPPSGFSVATYANTFENTADATRDFRLKAGSALINAGTTDSLSALDIVGTTRSSYDVGAWEYGSGGGDTTVPVLTGTITISALTTTSYTATWPAGTDNVAVTGYQYRLNSGSWIDAGNVLSVNITGRTPGSTDTLDVRAYDAAGNYSTPPISQSITLNSVATGTITIPAVKDWGTGTLKTGQSGVQVDVRNISTGALVVRKTGQTTHATTGVCVVTDAAIVAGTTYEVVTRFADGSKGMWDYTAT